eukprot:scaffold2435_cov92-Skeletonema_dohrnii-CCMP3373.AAC.10
MAEQEAEDVTSEGANTTFLYTGREQVVPDDVTHVIIDRSVKIIPAAAFWGQRKLLSVDFHPDIEKVEHSAFYNCDSLRGAKLLGVREVGYDAFFYCQQLLDMEFGANLERIGDSAYYNSRRLRRIAIPLKDNMFIFDTRQGYNQLDYCANLTTVDLVGGIHKTVASLGLESWRSEMNSEIDRINQTLPNTRAWEKTDTIRLWLRTVIDRIEHYKFEHQNLLKEDMTQLELAIWKAKLDEKEEEEEDSPERRAKKAKIDVDCMRKEKRITSGADLIIKNVLPFLQLG